MPSGKKKKPLRNKVEGFEVESTHVSIHVDEQIVKAFVVGLSSSQRSRSPCRTSCLAFGHLAFY